MFRLVAKGSATRIEVRVRPRASRSRVLGERDGVLDVAIAAPPVDGAANRALVALLAATLGVAKSRVCVLRGESGRNKLIEVVGVSAEELEERLERAFAL